MIKARNANVQIPFIVVTIMRQQPRKFLVVAASAALAISMVNESYPDESVMSLQQLDVDTILMNSDDVIETATDARPKRIVTGGH